MAYKHNQRIHPNQESRSTGTLAFSKLEIIYCAFQAEDKLVNALILFIRVWGIPHERSIKPELIDVFSWRSRRSGKAPTTDPTLTYEKKTFVSDMHADFNSM
jgi:hypothetical protein